MANITNFETRSNLPVNAPRLNFVQAVAFLVPVGFGALATLLTLNPGGAIVGVLLGLLLAQSPKIARQWERAVVLRLGSLLACVVRDSSGSFRLSTLFPRGWTSA